MHRARRRRSSFGPASAAVAYRAASSALCRARAGLDVFRSGHAPVARVHFLTSDGRDKPGHDLGYLVRYGRRMRQRISLYLPRLIITVNDGLSFKRMMPTHSNG